MKQLKLTEYEYNQLFEMFKIKNILADVDIERNIKDSLHNPNSKYYDKNYTDAIRNIYKKLIDLK